MQKYLLNGFEVFKVLPISHEILRKKIFEHYNFTNKEEDTLSTMIDTLRLYNKLHSIEALALAAPQVGWEKRLFVCADLELQQRKKQNIFRKLIDNQKSNDLIVSKENCLSIPPNQIACVMRSNKITMKYYNLLGIEMVVEAEGLQACIYQHEIDHLDGINALEKATSIIDSQQR